MGKRLQYIRNKLNNISQSLGSYVYNLFTNNKNNIPHWLEWKLRILDNKFNKYSTFRTFIIKFKYITINRRRFFIKYHIKRILCITKSKNNVKQKDLFIYNLKRNTFIIL